MKYELCGGRAHEPVAARQLALELVGGPAGTSEIDPEPELRIAVGRPPYDALEHFRAAAHEHSTENRSFGRIEVFGIVQNEQGVPFDRAAQIDHFAGLGEVETLLE